MKTGILASAVIGLSLASALGQGTILLDNNIPGIVVTHYYRAALGEVGPRGNGPDDFPPGTADYSRTFPLEGTGYSVQLFAAPGGNKPASALLPAFPVTTFRTGAGAGFVVPTTVTLTGVPADAQAATVQLRFWDNKGGTITNWGEADGVYAFGNSKPITIFNIGGEINPAPALVGLESASMGFIPEPSAGWLLGAGLAAIAAWRRGFFPRP